MDCLPFEHRYRVVLVPCLANRQATCDAGTVRYLVCIHEGDDASVRRGLPGGPAVPGPFLTERLYVPRFVLLCSLAALRR